MKQSFRDKAYKEQPELAKQTDFLMQHEAKLKKLHQQYQKDTGDIMTFMAFADFVYHNAQDLVFNPSDN
jgi:hypothetical protein